MQQQNPFADLIPQQAQDNPFADLIPAEKKPMTVGEALSESGNKIAEAMKTGLRRSAVGIGDVLPDIAGLGLSTLSPSMGKVARTTTNAIGRPQLDAILGSKEENLAKDKAFSQLAEGNPILHAIALGTELAPTALVGGGAGKLAEAPKFIQNALKHKGVMKALGDIVGLGAKNAVAGSGMGATMYDPNSTTEEKALKGGIAGGIGGAALGAVPLFRPSTYLARNINPQELQRVQEAIGDSPTGLGRVINSPALTRLQENVLARIPGTGVIPKYKQIGNELEQEGEAILGKLLGTNAPEDIGSQLGTSLNKAKGEVSAQKTRNYKEANEYADKMGLNVAPINFKNQVKQELKFIDTLKEDSKFKNELKKVIKEASTIGKKPTGYYGNAPFSETYLTKGYINRKLNDAFLNDESKNLLSRQILGNLKGALVKDVKESVEKSGDKELIKKFNEAERYYKEDYAPFKEAEIKKFTNRKGDTDLLTNFFVRTGKNDRGNLAEKLISKLPEDKKGLLAFDYLSRAKQKNEGTGALEFNATKLGNLWSNLGEKTQKSLVKDPGLRRQLDNYVIKMNRNREALNMMHNPPTGQRVMEMFLPSAIGGAAGSLYGGKEGGLTGALAGLGGTVLGGRLINRALTSPKTREKMINRILGKEKTSLKKNILTAAEIGALGRIGREEEQ